MARKDRHLKIITEFKKQINGCETDISPDFWLIKQNISSDIELCLSNDIDGYTLVGLVIHFIKPLWEMYPLGL